MATPVKTGTEPNVNNIRPEYILSEDDSKQNQSESISSSIQTILISSLSTDQRDGKILEDVTHLSTNNLGGTAKKGSEVYQKLTSIPIPQPAPIGAQPAPIGAQPRVVPSVSIAQGERSHGKLIEVKNSVTNSKISKFIIHSPSMNGTLEVRYSNSDWDVVTGERIAVFLSTALGDNTIDQAIYESVINTLKTVPKPETAPIVQEF